MCSFLILLQKLYEKHNLIKLNELLVKRGPDSTTILHHNGYTFIHNILHLCGDITLQPIYKNNIMLLFNGEIYNYNSFGNYKSDTECIIDMYLKYGLEFVNYLNGEYAIILFDYNDNTVNLCSDIFGTKPLFYSFCDNGFIISSIKKTLIDNNLTKNEIIRLEANTCLKLNFNNNLIKKINTHTFDLRQIKKGRKDFNRALEKSIITRAIGNNKNKKDIFITLSSGYDSGIIDLILKNNNINYDTYTIEGIENINILKERINNNNTYIKLTNEDYYKSKNDVLKTIDSYSNELIRWGINKETREIKKKIINYNHSDDGAIYGLNYIFNIAKNKHRIYLSGQGADEIFGDYGFNGKKMKSFSQLCGIFPDNLETIFPWNNFFSGSMKAFIAKEETISSLHGIETRYPFLDKNVVQEFLYLKPKLKNDKYKSPLYHYMTKYNYPFEENVKKGFTCSKNLI